MRKVKTRCPARLRLVVLLTAAASLAALAVSSSAVAHDIKKAAAGETYEDVRGIGPAKAAGKGLLRVKLKNADPC